MADKVVFMKLTEVTNTTTLANIVVRIVYIDVAKAVCIHREGNRFTRIRFSGDTKNSIDVTEDVSVIIGVLGLAQLPSVEGASPMVESFALEGQDDGRTVPGVSTTIGEISNPPINPDASSPVGTDLGQ